jgi:RND superfamily putative drug exporter
VVRCLLVPAMVALFGRANWWLPGWLGRVLRIAEPAAAATVPVAAAVAAPAGIAKSQVPVTGQIRA